MKKKEKEISDWKFDPTIDHWYDIRIIFYDDESFDVYLDGIKLKEDVL